MFVKKLFSAFVLAAILSSACDLFNSFGGDGAHNPVSHFSLDSNSLTLASGAFASVAVLCGPESEQAALDIFWEYDDDIIDIIPDNFSVTVYGIKPGSATLKASIYGFSSLCTVTVTGSVPAAFITPYVYSNASFVSLAPDGEPVRVAASLAGGAPNDISGFSFETEHSGIVSIVQEGNVAWLKGVSQGMTRVTVRHNKSSYPYSFIASCSPGNVSLPYITTDSNVITLNKSLPGETAFSVSMVNSNPSIYDGDYSFSVLDDNFNRHSNPPVSVSANGKDFIVSPLIPGECFIRISHASPDVFYPLDVLVIVYEQIENVYIEIPEPIVYVNGSAAAAFSVSLVNLPPDVAADLSAFVWTFPDNVSEFVDYNIFGGASFGTGNSLWLSGKKSGSFSCSVEHPLAFNKRSFFVVVKNIAAEAVDASCYITTTQNYVLSSVSADPVTIGVTLHNFARGEENSLLWSVEHNPDDRSGGPVIEYAAATGSYSSVPSRSAYVPVTSGELTVKPLREGSAVISVSHPKAFYDTKILVSIVSDNALLDEKPFLISTDSPLITILNGQYADVSVSLNGETVRAADEADIAWNSSDPSSLRLSSSGAFSRISAEGSGFSRNSVTVTHPKAQTPLVITVISGDDGEQIAGAKYVLAMRYSYVIEENQTVFVSAFINNAQEGDALRWNVTSGLNSVISIAQIDPCVISVTGLKNGLASVTASIAGSQDAKSAASFQILVSSNDAPPSKAAYISTSDNVVILGLEEEKTAAVTPVNIPADNLFLWSGYDASLIDVIPNNTSAVIRSKGVAGSTSISVSHPKSANVLTVNVRVGGRYVYENTDFAYIAVPSDTVVLTAGGNNSRFAVLLARTESPDTLNTGFSFSSSSNSVAALEHFPGSNTVFITPLAAGQSVLTIKHPDAPDREVLIIVEQPSGGSRLTPYITSSQNIVTVVSGGTAAVSASLVNALSYNNSEWRWSVEPNSSVSVIANNGQTAIIRGYNPGQAVVSVFHDKAPHPLTFTVLCVDRAAASAKPWIKTNFSILALKVGTSETITAEMIGGSGGDNDRFVFSVTNQAAVFINQSSSGVYVRGVAPGTSTITVTNSLYPAADPGNKKSILVVVEQAADGDTYITVDKNSIVMNPEASAAAVVNASITGPHVSPADSALFAWWADDYSIVRLDAVANSASVLPTGKSGVTAVHVKHPKSAYSVDIIVSVGRYSQFSFAEQSKSVPRGGTSFISMRVPPQQGSFKIEYSSSNPSVCEIIGSNSVAMIAGISSGQTTVSASLVVDDRTVSAVELPVIVGLSQVNSNSISVVNSVITLETGRQQALSALLSGPDISEPDKFNILWVSDNPSVASLYATSNGLAKGPDALVTAAGPGETFIAVSHEKVKYEPSPLMPLPELIVEYIWIVVPDQNAKSVSLSRSNAAVSSIVMFKDDPDVKISANIANGSQADYSNIAWSAPRSSGQNIISIRGNGRDCNIHPLNIGTTTLRAQLPDGIYADCLVTVQASSGISISSASVRLNPGYSETVAYSVTPDNALIQWNDVLNASSPSNEIFSFHVDTAAKTITVTALSIGSGYIQGIMLAGGSGGASNSTVRLNVFVEYNYSFEIDPAALISIAEPYPETFVDIPYSVYPKNLTVELETISSANERAVSLFSVSHDYSSGTGVIRLKALAEKDNIVLWANAFNPGDKGMAPIRRSFTLRLVYNAISVTPKPYTEAGSFSGFSRIAGVDGNDRWILKLGDGEDVLFYFDFDQENADIDTDINNIRFSYQAAGSLSQHNQTGDGNYIRAGYDYETNDINSNRRLFRIRHTADIVNPDFYLITKDLSYRDISITELRETTKHMPASSSSPDSFRHENQNSSSIYGYFSNAGQTMSSSSNTVIGPAVLNPKLGQGFIWYSLNSGYPKMDTSDTVFTRIVSEHEMTTTGYGYPDVFRTVSQGRYQNFNRFLPIFKDKEGPVSFSIYAKKDSSEPTGGGNSGTPSIPFVTREFSQNTYSFTVQYENCIPYVIPKDDFEDNLNYYLPALPGYEAVQLHMYASQTSSKSEAITSGPYNGLLVMDYFRLNQWRKIEIEIIIEVRDCEAFSKGRWSPTPGKGNGYWTLNVP